MKVSVEQIEFKDEFKSWAIWGCEASEFDWEYSDKESCYILSGEAEITFGEKKVTIKQGDFVVFPKGLSCRWKVLSPIKKHYAFGELVS